MKINFLKTRVLILFLTVITAFFGCVKSSTTTPPVTNPTIAQTIKSGTNLTLFNAALVRTGLDTVLNNPDSLATVFVITDQIMSTNGLSATVIDTMNVDTLKKILEYSILLGQARLSSALINGDGQNVKIDSLAGGDSIFVTYTGTLLFINGISVPTTDVRASNGYLDVMALPLRPPAGSILQIMQSDTTLSFFDSAVLKTASTANDIQSLLSNGSINTVFVPNNNAFRAAGYLTSDTFNIIDPSILATFLSYHIVSGRYFTSDMSIGLSMVSNDTTTINPVSGGTIKISQGSYYEAEGTSDSVAANIYQPNIMAHNGVIHKIDRILRQ